MQLFSFTMGLHFVIVDEGAANLTSASGSVGCDFTLASSTCVGSEMIDLQPNDVVHFTFYLISKSDIGVRCILISTSVS